jgi:hypothetical protein
MNKQQRNQWDKIINQINDPKVKFDEVEFCDFDVMVAANAYILKLERELQNLKGGRKIAAILKSKVAS